MKTHVGVEVQFHAFITSALNVLSGQFQAPAVLLPGKQPPLPRWTGCWVGPRTGLDAVVKRKISSPFLCHKSNPGCLPRSLVTVMTELLRLLFT